MLCRLAGAFRLLFAAHGAKPGAVGTAKQHRGNLEHKLLIEPFIYIQMSFFVQRKVKIRIIQIPFLYRPLRIDRLLRMTGSRQRAHSPCTDAFARSVIRTSSPSVSASKTAVTGCGILAPA